MGWVNACEVLQKEIVRLRSGEKPLEGHEIIATRGRRDMKYLEGMCSRLEVLYPDHASEYFGDNPRKDDPFLFTPQGCPLIISKGC
jgi:hypothetical protein